MILVVAVPRAQGAGRPTGAAFAARASAFTEPLGPESGQERNYRSDLAGPEERVPRETKQELLLPHDIPLRFDGILCHAVSLLTLLFGVMP